MQDWTSYRPADFVPYTAESWLALIERAGESAWPLHVVALAFAIAAPVLVRAGYGRIVLGLLAVAWAWVGWTFLLQRYAMLNWAGEWLGWFFFGQAVVLAALSAGWHRARAGQPRRHGVERIGPAVILVGAAGLPAITGLAGGMPFRAETFAIHPDPTAVVTIGVCLMTLRASATAVALAVPVLWCAASALHLRVLGFDWWPLHLLVVVGAAIAFGQRVLSDRGQRRSL